MLKICLPKEDIDVVKALIVKQNTLSNKKTAGELSRDRLDFFTNKFGKERGVGLAKLLDRTVLVKKQDRAVNDFLKKISSSYKDKTGEILKNKIALKNERLGNEELASFLKSQLDRKYNIDISNDDILKISEAKKRIRQYDINPLVEGDDAAFYNDSIRRQKWAEAVVEAQEALDNARHPYKQITLQEAKDTLGGSFKNYIDNIKKEDNSYMKVLSSIGQPLSKLLSSPLKALSASGDISFAGRQALPALYSWNPKEWINAFGKANQLITAGNFNEVNKLFKKMKIDTVSRPSYKKAMDAGLALGVVDDAFDTITPERIKGLRWLYAVSQKHFSVMADELRLSLFDKFAKELNPNLSTDEKKEALKAYAEVINNMTGTTNIKTIAKASQMLNNIFFSPRYMYASIKNLAPLSTNKYAAELRAKNFAKMATSFVGLYYVMGLLGIKTETDPRSSNFGKVKIPGEGNQWVDVSGGLGSYITLLTRLATQEKKSIKGKVLPINTGKYGSSSGAELIGNFFKNKLNPQASALMQFASNQDYEGRETRTPAGVARVITTPLTPITGRNLYEGLKQFAENPNTDEGMEFIIGTLTDLVGLSNIDYNNK